MPGCTPWLQAGCVHMKHMTAFRHWYLGTPIILPFMYLTQSKSCALSVTLWSSACWARQGHNLRSCSPSWVYNHGKEVEKTVAKNNNLGVKNDSEYINGFPKSLCFLKILEISLEISKVLKSHESKSKTLGARSAAPLRPACRALGASGSFWKQISSVWVIFEVPIAKDPTYIL